MDEKGRVGFEPPKDRNELIRSNRELQALYNTALDAIEDAEAKNTQLFGAYQNTLIVLACVLHDIATKRNELPALKYQFPRAAMDAVILKAINARFEQFDKDGNPISDVHKVEMDHTIVEITLKDGQTEQVIHKAKEQIEGSRLVDPEGQPIKASGRRPRIVIPQ